MFKSKGYKIENYSFSLLIVIALLCGIGLIVLQTITKGTENQGMANKQLIGIIAGFILAFILSFIDYHFICKFAIPLYFVNIILMLICKYVDKSNFPYFYGKSVDQARRWIRVEKIKLDIMPSEITKIVLIICLAKLFFILEEKINKLSSLVLTFLVAGIPIYLVYDQPDLSTTIVISATVVIMIFIAGLTLKIVIPVLAVTIPAFIAFIWYVQQDYSKTLLKPWQRERILSILHPEDYPDLMYQQNRAKTAIRAGGMFGKMITGSSEKKMTRFVPVVESDFIFSAVGEELGFFGCMVVIALFLVFFGISLKIALRAKDKLGRYIALGIAVMITIQASVNIGVVLSLLPNTGIPLPFMSSGLSSLLISFLYIGMLINIGLQNKDTNPIEKDVIYFGKYHREENQV